MSLDWIRLETSIAGDEKIVDLIERKRHTAVVAYVFSLAYCGHQENHGFIHRGSLPMFHATKKDADDLVAVGLWDKMPSGWAIPNFDKYQLTNISAQDRTVSGKLAACKRWHSQPCAKCSPADDK